MNKSTMIDYREYKLSKVEYIKLYIVAILYCITVSWIFFRSIPVSIVSILFSKIYINKKRKSLYKLRNQRLLDEFIYMLNALKVSLRTCGSIEKGLNYASHEVMKMYGRKSYLLDELVIIINKSKFNVPITESFDDFARRTDIYEIKLFSNVMKIMKKRGGNLIEVIDNTVQSINAMARTDREVELILAGKINEKRIMDKMPLAIIGYISLTSYEVVSPLFESTQGRILMVISLLIYSFAYYIGEKILESR